LAAPFEPAQQGVFCDAKITTLRRKLQLKTVKKPHFYWGIQAITDGGARTAD
jgi:hypothetical protein